MKYIPFLKAKKNELNGLALALSDTSSELRPFLDIPRVKDDNSVKLKRRVDLAASYIASAQEVKPFQFYIDVFDIDLDIKIDGMHVYSYVLSKISGFNFIPVYGFDRDPDFLNSILQQQENFQRIAIRLQIEDVSVPSLCLSDLNDLFMTLPAGLSVDLIIDMRLLEEDGVDFKIEACRNFLKQMPNWSQVDDIIITSSSIPAVITSLIDTNDSKFFSRLEWRLWTELSSSSPHKITYGDYTVVSPLYSDADIPPELMRSVQTPRIIYAQNDIGFVVRGKALKTDGDAQYFRMAELVLTSGICRARNFSSGDNYIHQVVGRELQKVERKVVVGYRCGSASKWIEMTVNCHVVYFIKL